MTNTDFEEKGFKNYLDKSNIRHHNKLVPSHNYGYEIGEITWSTTAGTRKTARSYETGSVPNIPGFEKSDLVLSAAFPYQVVIDSISDASRAKLFDDSKDYSRETAIEITGIKEWDPKNEDHVEIFNYLRVKDMGYAAQTVRDAVYSYKKSVRLEYAEIKHRPEMSRRLYSIINIGGVPFYKVGTQSVNSSMRRALISVLRNSASIINRARSCDPRDVMESCRGTIVKHGKDFVESTDKHVATIRENMPENPSMNEIVSNFHIPICDYSTIINDINNILHYDECKDKSDDASPD